MTNKYVILDEIELNLVYDTENAIPLIFATEKQAREYAENNIQGWQIIEVPFDEPEVKKCSSCGGELQQVAFKDEGDSEDVWWCRECDLSIDSDKGVIK